MGEKLADQIMGGSPMMDRMTISERITMLLEDTRVACRAYQTYQRVYNDPSWKPHVSAQARGEAAMMDVLAEIVQGV